MRIAILGGSSEDERHLVRLSEKLGLVPAFIRARAEQAAGVESLAPPAESALEQVLERLAGEALDEPTTSVSDAPARPRALIFDASERGERPDVAVRLLAAVRRDPYFDRVGALLILQAEHAAASSLPGGFDDFVLYPTGVHELWVRVRALRLRRSGFGSGAQANDTGIVVDETSRDVFVDGRAVQLTAREFALFTYLCEWRGKVLSREHLLARVWGSRYSGGRRTVDIHVRRLRAKLGASLAIETLRGSGYRLRREPLNVVAPSLVNVVAPTLVNVVAPVLPVERVRPFPTQIPEPFSKVS